MSSPTQAEQARAAFTKTALNPAKVIKVVPKTPQVAVGDDFWPQMHLAHAPDGTPYWWGEGNMSFSGRGTRLTPGLPFLPDRVLTICRPVKDPEGDLSGYEVDGQTYEHMGVYVRNGGNNPDGSSPEMEQEGDVLIGLGGKGDFEYPARNGQPAQSYSAIKGFMFHSNHFFTIRTLKEDHSRYSFVVRITPQQPRPQEKDPTAADHSNVDGAEEPIPTT